MSPTARPIVAELQQEFEALVSYVSGPASADATAYTVECTIFRRLLAIGAGLLRVFFDYRAASRPTAPVTSPDGTVLSYHDRRLTSYFSIFGKIGFSRHAFWAPGHAVVCPLDAALSLPARCYSDLLREWAAYGATDGSYRESQTLLSRILALPLSLQALETAVTEDAADVATFYEQPIVAAPGGEPGTLLVVEADGKGVPIVRSATAPPRPLRRGNGQPPGTMKEAIVTSLYTIAPFPRTPDQVRAALLTPPGTRSASTSPASLARPTPIGKEVRATLAGKTVALTTLAARAGLVAGLATVDRVALTDGSDSLQRGMLTSFPDATLVLDIIHATEHLWKAATLALGEGDPARAGWVWQALGRLLTGQAAAIVTEIAEAATDAALSGWQRNELRLKAAYFERNQPYLRYDQYLARGWPIGTGVVEGACGHLVKDRMEQAGMRWTLAGAQPVLDLRAVRLNEHWDAYWTYHRQQAHHRCYGTIAVPDRVEDQALQAA